MIEIPRSLLDSRTDQINALSKAGQDIVADALSRVEWHSIEELRTMASEIMQQTCSALAENATVIAAGMYDDVREIAVGDRLDSIPESPYDPAATDGAVRALVETVKKTGSTDRFVKELKARVDYEVKKASGDSVIRMTKADSRYPRFARVPSGSETCRFCLMLASRGAVYHNEIKAGSDGHYHSKCDCRIVPFFPGQTVEGYDPDALYRVWERLENAETISKSFYKGSPSDVEREAADIDAVLSRAWREYRHGDRSKESYQSIYGGTVASYASSGSIAIEDFTKAHGKEVQLASWLSNYGEDVVLRNPNVAFGKGESSADFMVFGKTYEAKRITSSYVKKIGTRINEKADKQGPRYIIDLSCSKMRRDDAEIAIAWLLEDERVEEILLVKSGTLKRFRK